VPRFGASMPHVVGLMSPAAARFAQRLAIRVHVGPEPFGDVLGAVARRPPTTTGPGCEGRSARQLPPRHDSTL